jgi:ribonuclease PH
MAIRVTTVESQLLADAGSVVVASQRSQVSCTASSASETLPRMR